jgi:nucleotidyltransferase substrate binding protein (TIGR01987 family)
MRQRREDFQRALGHLLFAVRLKDERALSQLEQQGLIQAFEFTHELAWNVLADISKASGGPPIRSRDATRFGLEHGLISDADSWFSMIDARNESPHTFDCDTAAKISGAISERYAPLLQTLSAQLESTRGD